MKLIDRTFSILEIFLEHNEALNITDLIKLSGLSPAVTHRIVKALLKNGYLYQREPRGRYTLGVKLLNYAYAIRKGNLLSNASLPFLVQLSKEADATSSIGILDGKDILVLERVITSHKLSIKGDAGKRAPLHSTALGKIFLAQMSKSELQVLFQDSPLIIKYTQNTITDYASMVKNLKTLENEGCTYDYEEMFLVNWSVAAPVYNRLGELEAGVAIMVPSENITNKKIADYTALTKLYAAKISQELAHRLE